MFASIRKSSSPLFALSLVAPLAPLAAGCDDPATPPPVVTIKSENPPALVAYREEGTEDWKALTAADDGTFRFDAPGPYRVAIACESSSAGASVVIKEYARTPEDGLTIEHPCARAAHPFHLRAQVAQPGAASFGDFSRGSFDPDWALDIPAAAGTYDLVMRTGNRIAIRRDIEITGDKDLGAIDLPPESTEELISTAFTVSNTKEGEHINASTRLDTGSTIAVLQDPMSGSGGFTTKLAPESALRATDRQTAIFMSSEIGTAGTQGRYRLLERDVRVGDPTTAALPEPIGDVTFEAAGGQLTATWTALPEHGEVALRWYSITMQGTKDHEVALSRSFLDATGATSAAVALRDIPGFKEEWRHAAGTQQTYTLTARRVREGEQALSQVNQLVLPGQP